MVIEIEPSNQRELLLFDKDENRFINIDSQMRGTKCYFDFEPGQRRGKVFISTPESNFILENAEMIDKRTVGAGAITFDVDLDVPPNTIMGTCTTYDSWELRQDKNYKLS